MGELDRIAHTVLPPADGEITHYVDKNNRILRTGIGQARVLWFYDEGRVIVLSHGFAKKTRPVPPRQVEKARRAKRTYLDAKAAGNLWIQGET